MCLEITQSYKKETKKFLKDKESIKGYKVIYRNNYSMYKRYFWKKGQLNISDRKSTKVSVKEVLEGEINYGFHFFVSKVYASYELPRLDDYKVIEVEVKAKHIVAVGYFHDTPCFVATKAFWNGETIKNAD
jgi:hypothetical protein